MDGFINDNDIKQFRKIAVISQDVYEIYLKKMNIR